MSFVSQSSSDPSCFFTLIHGIYYVWVCVLKFGFSVSFELHVCDSDSSVTVYCLFSFFIQNINTIVPVLQDYKYFSRNVLYTTVERMCWRSESPTMHCKLFIPI